MLTFDWTRTLVFALVIASTAHLLSAFNLQRDCFLSNLNLLTAIMSSFFIQLTTEQLEATGTKLCTILCSVLFFFLLSTLTFLLSFRCSVIGRRKDLAKWCITIPRFVFGVSVPAIGFYFVVIDDTLKKNIIYAKTPLSTMGLYFMEGYCIYEVIYCSLFKSLVLY